MNTLVIEKQTGGYFKFTLNGDTANAITSIQNDLLAVGTQLHFKTGNGANIIKEQFIYPADVTIIASGTFTFTTVAQVWDKLIDIDYFAWLGGGGNGVDRFDDLLDTFQYTGNAGKAVIVDNSELKLVPITLYNKRLFTELEDTPSSLVPDKMVVVNPAGTALILKDQPKPPEEYLNSVGYFDYNDLATQTTPLNATANVALKLTNDTEGANTSTDQNPYGVSYVWDYTTNQFNFTELEVGDTIDVRVHVQVTTTSANQKVVLSAKFGIGSVSEFTNIIYENQFKSAGLHEINFVAPFYMGSTYITDNPAELYLTTDSSATVKVDGWYVRILRKNINIITVDYQVPDATTLAKGIVRLAGDLGGTANVPTVPELANKVPTSRTVSTTSPLLGGGALSSNLTLSIQQANSVDSGFLTYADWTRFDEAHNDRIVSAAVTGTTTKTLTLNQHDGGFIETNWTDNDTAITLGSPANGLALADRVLSLGLSSASTIGALSSTDWNTFNNKQGALNGTGFVKVSGTTISYDNSTYALDSVVVKLTGNQTISGQKTFSSTPSFDSNIYLKHLSGWSNPADYTVIGGRTDGFLLSASSTKTALIGLGNLTQVRTYDFPNKAGTFAMTSDLHNPVTIGGGFNGLSIDSNQVLSLVLASASVNGALSSTDWTTFNNKQGALNGTGFVKVSGTTISYDNSTYALDSVVVKLTGDQTIAGAKTFSSPVQASAFRLTGMTAGNGALYWSSDRVTLANYNTNGVVEIEALGGASIATFGNSIDFTKTVFVSSNLYANGLVSRGTPANTLSYLSGSGAIFIRSLADETAYAFQLNTSSGLDLWSTTSGGTSTRRLTLDSSGNVGIGTTNPASIGGFTTLAVNGSTGGLFDLMSGGTTYGRLYSVTNNLIVEAVGTSNIQFAANGAERMRITSGGNVGIGTTSPSSPLMIKVLSDNNIRFHNDAGVAQIACVNDAVSAHQGFKLGNNWINLLSNGNVGIGTTSPVAKLDMTDVLRIQSSTFSAPASGMGLELRNVAGASSILSYDRTNALYKPLVFDASDITIKNNGNNAIYLSSAGNVGIGTTSPNSYGAGLIGLTLDGSTTSFVTARANGVNKITLSANGGGGTPVLQANDATTDLGFQVGGSERMRIFSSGNVFIGSSPVDAGYKLDVNGTSRFVGNMTVTGTVTASGGFFNSDMRLKDLTDYDYNVSDIKPITYLWKDGRDNKKHVGYSAQEVQKVMPDAVNEGTDGMLSVNYIEVLVAKIAELENRIKQLEK